MTGFLSWANMATPASILRNPTWTQPTVQDHPSLECAARSVVRSREPPQRWWRKAYSGAPHGISALLRSHHQGRGSGLQAACGALTYRLQACVQQVMRSGGWWLALAGSSPDVARPEIPISIVVLPDSTEPPQALPCGGAGGG